MKLEIKSLGCVSDEDLVRNLALAPKLPNPAGQGRLAVVGGGNSIADKIDRLRDWPGDIWAINGAWRWCAEHGIKTTFYSVDPQPDLVDLVQGVTSAVLAEHCDPGVFIALRGQEVCTAKGSLNGPTSAVTASVVALRAGYTHVTYFGCESSYGETTHVYDTGFVPDLVKVSCNGAEYLTKMELLLQVDQLSDILRTLPATFAEESGGFLAALVAAGDYDVTHGSPSLHEAVNG